MPRVPKINLPPAIDSSHEAIGQRIARLRKASSMTQHELADKIGVNRSMVTDYECGRVRLYDEILARLAIALNTTTDEILGLKPASNGIPEIPLRIIKRLQKIESLPQFDQKSLLRTIDVYLKAAESNSSDS